MRYPQYSCQNGVYIKWWECSRGHLLSKSVRSIFAKLSVLLSMDTFKLNQLIGKGLSWVCTITDGIFVKLLTLRRIVRIYCSRWWPIYRSIALLAIMRQYQKYMSNLCWSIRTWWCGLLILPSITTKQQYNIHFLAIANLLASIGNFIWIWNKELSYFFSSPNTKNNKKVIAYSFVS